MSTSGQAGELDVASNSVDGTSSAGTPARFVLGDDLENEIERVLNSFPEALQAFKQRSEGESNVGIFFKITNILHTGKNVLEASNFYRLAFDFHDKSPGHYPLAHSLLQASLLCLLKAGKEIPQEEMAELRGYSIPCANYINGIRLAWKKNDHRGAVDSIGNAFEEFHTGEEIDSLYLEICRNLYGNLLGSSSAAELSPIPFKLYMYWDKNPPAEILKNFEYHKDLLKEKLRIFDHEEASEWLYQNYGVEAREIFLGARHPAEAADFLRVHVINRLGGWWLDADLKLKGQSALCYMSSNRKSGQYFTTTNDVVHNDFFGSCSNSEILSDCLLSLYRNSYLHHGLFIAYKTGPGVFNRAFSRTYHRSHTLGAGFPMIEVSNQSTFNTLIEEFDTPYKHTTLHWQAV